MRFHIYFTTDRSLHSQEPRDQWPKGVTAEPYVRRSPVPNALWRDDPVQLAHWLANGHELDDNGTPVEVYRSVYHYMEIATLDDLMALARSHGQLIVWNDPGEEPAIEIYNDYRD